LITLGFCNLKGGVGKTTACQNIAVALAKAGRKIAVIDMDPQSNLSAGFGVIPGSTDPQVFDLLTDEAKWDDIVKQKEGVDIIPSSLNLVMAELNNSGLFDSDLLLHDALQQIDQDRYDYILLDSPPQLGIFTRNVLAACNKVIVPMDGGYYSLFGLKLLESAIPVLSGRLRNELEILGILMTNYNPRFSVSHTIFDEVKKSFGDVLFESYVSQSVSLIEASSMGMSIFGYSPKSKAAQCYKEVAEELLKRLEGRAGKIEISKRKAGRPKKSAKKIDEVPEKIIETPAPEQEQEPIPEPTPAPEKEPEPEIKNIKISELEQELEKDLGGEIEIEIVNVTGTPEPVVSDTVPDNKPEPPEPKSDPSDPPKTGGTYEQGIKQDLIDMLPDRQKAIWAQILAPIHDVSRGEIDVKELRDDFQNSDKYRYTFYVLTDENDKLDAVSFPDQIVEPLRCVVKLDENGSAEIFF